MLPVQIMSSMGVTTQNLATSVTWCSENFPNVLVSRPVPLETTAISVFNLSEAHFALVANLVNSLNVSELSLVQTIIEGFHPDTRSKISFEYKPQTSGTNLRQSFNIT